MALTPVRIRGKRKASSVKTLLPTMTTNIDNKTSNDIVDRNPKKLRRPIISVLASRSSRPRPKLQAFPAEILESIFLYSSNLALPRSSPDIGAKLSSRATLLRFFMWAFHETWDKWFGVVDKAAANWCDGDPTLQVCKAQLAHLNPPETDLVTPYSLQS